jgi:hypothetical protein
MARSPASSLAAPDLVLTPGGWRPRSQVHRMERGHHISGRNGRIRIVESDSGRLVKDLGRTSKRPRKQTRKPSNRVAAATNDYGWIEYVQWTNPGPQPIALFSATWTVPPPPAADDDHTIFLFTGLQQTVSGPYILQPVLQWGSSEVGGGDYWSISNWYVNGQGGKAIQGPTPERVEPGAVLQGVISLTGQANGAFSYVSFFVGYEQVDATVQDIDPLAWACITLECYGADADQALASCDDYPATPSTAFTQIALKVGADPPSAVDAPLDWEPLVPCTSCGQTCSITQNGSPGGGVVLNYRAA